MTFHLERLDHVSLNVSDRDAAIAWYADVLGLDWRVDLGAAWQRLGHDVAVQGNLDPAVLLAGTEQIRRAAREILDAAAGRLGHVFNLGHGIHKETPVERVKALVDMVHEMSAR